MVYIPKKPLNRSTFIRGAGVCIALPYLEAMAKSSPKQNQPKRMAFVYSPNGMIMDKWTPKKEGKNYELPPTLAAFSKVKNDFQIISGLAHDKANANGDGAGDHARATATFTTGCQAKKTGGRDIRNGISVDQVAAQKLGHITRFPSLELSTVSSRFSGSCDSGYSCVYQYNLAWKNESTPIPPDSNPRQIFTRLFYDPSVQEGAISRKSSQRLRQSILDAALSDHKQLKHRLGQHDQHKLDEYFDSIRAVEKRMERSFQASQKLPKNTKAPEDIPERFDDHLKLIYDLIVLAWQTDTTRITTFLTAHDGSSRSYPELGVFEGHHELSHHRGDKAKIKKIEKIDRYHCDQFAYFLEKLKNTKEGDSNLLDSSMVVFGGGISDGNRHRHHDLPVILAGRGGVGLETGRHIKIEKTPMTNLYLSMLDQFGAPYQQLGDSTGKLNKVVS